MIALKDIRYPNITFYHWNDSNLFRICTDEWDDLFN